MTEVLLTGLKIGESARWHDGRLWLSNWGAQQVLAVDLDGEAEVVVVGRVRRRWFRSGGATQSRTEVVAEGVVPRRAGKRVAKLVGDALTVADRALSTDGGRAIRARG